MKSTGLLKVVVAEEEGARCETPAQRVFEHWVAMFGKRRGLVAFGPKRRRLVESALALYPEATLLLAIDGCAASAWHAGDNDRGKAFNDLELILRDEAHIERFAEDGEALHQRALRELRRERERAAAPAPEPEDPAAVAEQRARVQALARQLRGRA